MTRIGALLLATASFVVMAFAPAGGDERFGAKINEKGAVAATQLPQMLQGKQTVTAKVRGVVGAVCQQKGCWMTMDLGNGQTMRIRFKDYAFFVPKDCAGREAVIEGEATVEVTSVEEQRHYAQDAGKSQAEIDAITQEKRQITFEATGVILKKRG